jgi:hypothetical protein
MSRSWIQQGDTFRPNFINDAPPQEILDVAERLDEFIAYAASQGVKVSISGSTILQGLAKYKKLVPKTEEVFGQGIIK